MNQLNIYQRLLEVMKEVESVEKNDFVKISEGRGYKAVSHDDVAALLHRPLTKHGIIAITEIVSSNLEKVIKTIIDYKTKEKIDSIIWKAEVCIQMTFVNTDAPSDRFTIRSHSYAFDSGDKAIGKAYSMSVKYAFLKQFILESYDNEEERIENKAEVVHTRPKAFVHSLDDPLGPEKFIKQEKEISIPLQSPDKKIIEDKVRIIKSLLSDITRDKTPNEKKEFLRGNFKVSTLGEFLNSSINELNSVIKKLEGMTTLNSEDVIPF